MEGTQNGGKYAFMQFVDATLCLCHRRDQKHDGGDNAYRDEDDEQIA
jgi:hypothetical protein